MSDMAGSEPDWHRREGMRSSAAGQLLKYING